jgi:hypothetical protein
MSTHANDRDVLRLIRGRQGKLRRERLFVGASRPRRRHRRRPTVVTPRPTLEQVVLNAISRLEEIQVDIEQMRAELPTLKEEDAARWRAVIEEATTRLTRARLRLERLRNSGQLNRGVVLH